MKSTKSSYSLHCNSTGILTAQSTNQQFAKNYRIQWKKPLPLNKSSDSIYNARGKLNCMQAQMEQLSQQIKSVGGLNKQLRTNIELVKDSYLNLGLNDMELQLEASIKQLNKKVTIRIRSDLLIYTSLQQILNSQHKSHQELKAKFSQIEERVQSIENVMGVDRNLPQPYKDNQPN